MGCPQFLRLRLVIKGIRLLAIPTITELMTSDTTDTQKRASTASRHASRFFATFLCRI